MVKPIGTNAQSQRMVVTLKNICRDYPAGGGILRELLQNADDAGASKVTNNNSASFLMNVNITEPLIHEHLARYQGPALLAYNSAEFTDKDFENLKHTGDSYKLDDGSTTGRFGRGFNSVYNWTDSPSIVSRHKLLILDPHEWWSRDMGVSPVFDFVTDCGDPEIKNQMAAFSSIICNTQEPFEGTIIRVPLRTGKQAKESEIVDCEVTVDEVKKVLDLFAVEFRSSGLLFMRNIERLDVEATSGMAVNISLLDLETVRSSRSLIKAALKSAAQSQSMAFDHAFNLSFTCTSAKLTTTTNFVVHHHVHPIPSDEKLVKWMRKQKITPWVAVASPLQAGNHFQGSLFTVLPLPIFNAQPVHIHGLFSISPDRARLNVDDPNITDLNPATWNRFLFSTSIPCAWTGLLEFIAETHSHLSAFSWWPVATTDERDPLRKSVDQVIELVRARGRAVFPTVIGYFPASRAILDTGKESIALATAFDEACIPMVRAPAEIRSKIKPLFSERVICPRIVSQELHTSPGRIKTWTEATRKKVLEYLVATNEKVIFEDLELFPFEDGTYKSIHGGNAFLHRNDNEKRFFSIQANANIDVSRITEHTKRALDSFCAGKPAHSNVRYRLTHDFKEFCLKFIFASADNDRDILSAELDHSLFAGAWKWIDENVTTLSDEELACLWLLPLTNGTFRKVKPRTPSTRIMIARSCDICDIMYKFDKSSSSDAAVILDVEKTGLKDKHRLLQNSQTLDSLAILDSNNVLHLSQWLGINSSCVSSCSAAEKTALLKQLATQLTQDTGKYDRSSVISAIKPLELFQKLSWIEQGKHSSVLKSLLKLFRLTSSSVISTTWTSLSACTTSIGVLDNVTAFLEIDDTQILLTQATSDARNILEALGHFQCHTLAQFIEQSLIPNFTLSNSSFTVKTLVADLILFNYALLSKKSTEQLRKLSIVPVVDIASRQLGRFDCPVNLINPEDPTLTSIFFDTDEVCPEGSFYARHATVLKLCGLKCAIDDDIIQQQVKSYAESDRSMVDIQTRVHALLNSSRNPSQLHATQLRTLRWLPAMVDGILKRFNSTECRDQDDVLLAGLVLPILDLQLPRSWKDALGWNAKVDERVLLEQLKLGIDQRNSAVVDAVLQVTESIELLKTMSFVLTSSGNFSLPNKTFKTNCEGLSPYIENVDRTFWHNHQQLLRHCGIQEAPSLHDLLHVQKILEAKCPLTTSKDISVAVNLATRLAHYDYHSRKLVKILTENGQLLPPGELVYPNVQALAGDSYLFSHPEITQTTALALGIELLSDLRQKKLLEIQDIDDEDEFDQKEQITTRIRDTLDRYPIDSTFREYLANADDAGASELNWLLDERHHSCAGLLTSEIETAQGPALVVHNNSVFSEEDIAGFKNVGEGSKRRNVESIGQFGRGSQTMYHFTDTPMLLSGDFLIILDPQQQVLHYNQKKGQRKPGVKLPLKKLREACPSHLEAFEGLFGYTAKLDHYPGTIFRFPLRSSTTQSQLRDVPQFQGLNAVRQQLAKYFDEARISLLFLKNIGSIKYTVHGSAKPYWFVVRQSSSVLEVPRDNTTFTSLVTSVFFNSPNEVVAGNDEWRIAKAQVALPAEMSRSKLARVLKNAECGIAGLISSRAGIGESAEIFSRSPIPLPRVFSSLPLPLVSGLPVSLHAPFSVSGDRRSIIVGEHDDDSQTAWNNLMLNQSLPELYLSFLEHLAINLPTCALKFWPQSTQFNGSQIEQIFNGFMSKLPDSTRRLYLKLQNGQRLKHQASPDVINFQEATFHLQTDLDIRGITPLLLSLGVPLVQDLPPAICNALLGVDRANRITELSLRQMFQNGNGKGTLQEFLVKQPRAFQNFLELAIHSSQYLEMLNSCCFISLENNTLGKLQIRSNTFDPSDYFIVTPEESKLFNFANSILVTHGNWKSFAKVSKERYFTVEKLKLVHLPDLFKLHKTSAKFDRKWLELFWSYWRYHVTSEPKAKDSLQKLPVCLVKYNGKEENTCFEELVQRAAVIEPLDQTHYSLCTKFPSLQIFDKAFVPPDLLAAESSFYERRAFHRFIKALQKLCPAGQRFGDYVSSNLTTVELQLFSKLVVLALQDEQVSYNGRRGKSPDFHDVREVLASVPLWKNCDNTAETLLMASELFVIDEEEANELLVPWMKDYKSFVSDRGYVSTLTFLGATKITTASVVENKVFPLPNFTYGCTNWTFYRELISFLHMMWLRRSAVVGFLKLQLLAVDQDCNLRRTDQLLDHEDLLFEAAYRNQSRSRFLHENLRQYRQMWLDLGLRQTAHSNLTVSTYTECLKMLQQRLIAQNSVLDTILENDSIEIMAPLCTHSARIQAFTNLDWREVGTIAVFKSLSDMNEQPIYRQQQMFTIAVVQPFLRLSDIINPDYIGICWSQTAFSIKQPARDVLRHFNFGKPTIAMVWRHLQHLREMSEFLKGNELDGFLSDLLETYIFLQDSEPREVKQYSGQADIWLNIPYFDGNITLLSDVKTGWVEAKNLVLSSACDAGPKKAVKAGLMRFEKLLLIMGASCVIYPTVERPVAHVGNSVASSLRGLRDQGKFLDVHYHSEGKTTKAHSLVLASISEMCVSQFSPRWVKDVPRDANGALQFYFDRYDANGHKNEAFLSHSTLESIVEYAYDRKIDWHELLVDVGDDLATKQHKLDKLLDLLHGADYMLIDSLKSEVEGRVLDAGKELITIANVEKTLSSAAQFNAKAIEHYCLEFIRGNKAVLDEINPVVTLNDEQ